LWFWDWKSGHNYQQAQTIVQPGIVFFASFFFVLFCFVFYFPLFWVVGVWGGFNRSQRLITAKYFLSGSLDSEAGIYAISYDLTGSRLITCEADKTIKMWREDENATPETHPLNFRPPKDIWRF
jgi:pleiotropic regulator 1